MHVFDGVLSNEVCLAAAALSVPAVGYSLRRLRNSLADRAIPLAGMMSAFVFAGQMVNFPLPGAPVSGHLLGGVLAATVLGPWGACVALTAVLTVQCLLFHDGGLLALGVNVLHMAVVGGIGGYAVFAVLRRLGGGSHRATIAAVVLSSWLTVMAAATFFCAEFGLSWGTAQFDLRKTFSLMVTYHSLIGVGEALITGGIVGFLLVLRPDLIYTPTQSAHPIARMLPVTAAGIVFALAVAAFLAPFASEFPDGLEAVAQRVGFEETETAGTPLVLSEYAVPVPGVNVESSPTWQKVSVALAGILGTLAVGLIAFVLSAAIARRSPLPESSHGQ